MGKTKEELKAYKREHYLKNKETYKVKAKKWNLMNPERVKTRRTEYYANNREQRIQHVRIWQVNNRDKKNANCRRYYERNKEKIIKKAIERVKSTPERMLKAKLRSRVYKLTRSKNFRKNKTFFEYIGCTVEHLVQYLEERFKPGMTWDNHGDWHIDHIIPLASAKDIQELYKLNHYTNLQPLWAIDNMSKGCIILS